MCSEMPSQAYLHLCGFPLSASDFDYENYIGPHRTERRSNIEKEHHSSLEGTWHMWFQRYLTYSSVPETEN